MNVNFNLTGTKRKELVAAVSEIVGWQPVYKGAPTFAYAVNNFIIDKDGTLYCGDDTDSQVIENMLIKLELRGFAYERNEVNASETAVEIPNNLNIELSKEGYSETAIANLEKLVASKATLIKKALGTDSLIIEQTEDKLTFPWFSGVLGADEVNAYSSFVGALCAMAKQLQRVNATEKPVDNEKYAFRCFLLRLGFVGAEFKTVRKMLLKNLSGNSAFKSEKSVRCRNDYKTTA